jgi:hypothetical protein
MSPPSAYNACCCCVSVATEVHVASILSLYKGHSLDCCLKGSGGHWSTCFDSHVGSQSQVLLHRALLMSEVDKGSELDLGLTMGGCYSG